MREETVSSKYRFTYATSRWWSRASSIGVRVVGTVVICAVVACALPVGLLVAQDDIERIPNPFDDAATTFGDTFGNATTSSDYEASQNAGSAKAARSGVRIELQGDFRKASELARLEQRPMLAVFGADWCSWCRKLEGELESKDADAILKRWVVVKVDVDDEPALVEQLGVSALPSLRVLGKDQTAIASKEGYLPLVELEMWLTDHLVTADPTIQRVLYASGKLDATSLQQLKEFLGNRAPDLRVAAQERLSNDRIGAAGFVVDILRTGSLAQQLSAIDILRRWKAPVDLLDPWQPETMSNAAIDKLVEWLRNEADSSQPEDVDAEVSEMIEVDPIVVADLMRELLDESIVDRKAVLARATQLGTTVIPDLRLRLADSDALSDQQRTALRELLYRILVGPRVRLEQTTLLVALSSLDAETHRQAASAILDFVTSQDQLLVDELSNDSDPLVRELAVAKLQQLGALQEPQRLQRLLGDTSPSVRTAVLRQLAEHPNDKSIETLVSYLGEETDEDLLVYATKTLGQLGSTGKAESALITLVGNTGWRIRAATLDAITERIAQSDQNVFSFSGSSRQSHVSGPLAEAILKSMEDSDPFVAQKAVGLLPKIISKESAPSLLNYLQSHPQRLTSIDAEISEYQRDELFLPLVEHAQLLLKGEATEQVAIAAAVIAKLAPTKLRNVLPELLSSTDRRTRLSGIGGLLASLREQRITELEERSQAFLTARFSRIEMEPWHPVPESFLVIPKAMKRSSQADGPSTQLAQQAIELEPGGGVDKEGSSLFDDFFGTESASIASVITDEGEPPEEVMDADVIAETKSPENLDLADQLFGELPPSSASKPTKIEPKPKRTVNNLPSAWLTEWYSADQQSSRPKWISECVEIIDGSLQSFGTTADDETSAAERQNEVQWLRLALLACGELDQAEFLDYSLLDEVEQSKWLINALPWLPESKRLEFLRAAQLDFTNWKEPAIQDVLQAATEIDSREVLDWLVQEYSSTAERSANDLPLISDLVMRTLYGTLIEQRSTSFSSDELKSKDEAFTDFAPSTGQLPNREQAVESLYQLYISSDDPLVRSVILNALSRIDHRLATLTAVGRIASAESYDVVVEVSLAIALADQIVSSGDRAVLFLGHSLPEVRRAAMERLTSSSYEFLHERMQLGAALVYDYEEELPGLWYVRRQFDASVLTSDLVGTDTELKQFAKILRLTSSSATAESLDEFISSDEKQRTLVVAALAKAERTDPAALDYYRKSTGSLESPELIYAMLRNLRGDEIQSVRNQMRKQYGSGALQ